MEIGNAAAKGGGGAGSQIDHHIATPSRIAQSVVAAASVDSHLAVERPFGHLKDLVGGPATQKHGGGWVDAPNYSARGQAKYLRMERRLAGFHGVDGHLTWGHAVVGGVVRGE